MRKVLASLVAVLFAMTGVAYAQEAQQNAQQAEQAAPGVAHISFMQGQVSTQRGDSGDWVAATVNTPVMPGDKVSTAGGSRAEVQLDYANLIRLDQNSMANVTNLTRDQIQVQVAQGLVNYDVLRANGPSAEIDTPNMAVHPLSPGSYRIEVVSDSETRVVVRSGEAQISTPQGSTNLEAGQLITVQGTDNPQYQTASAPGEDDWDRWNSDRDSQILHAHSWRHTDPYYVGSENLDTYGRWQDVPNYGSVWVPEQTAGWAPYRDGRWVWEPYYGWTWVSYEPWGWAPYHYGRWFLYDNDWAWWPGPVVGYPGYYPIWAPAYVSFFGFGGGGWGGGFGFGFGFGFGNIGWLPIGPGDYFCPWWGGWGGRFAFDRFGDFDRFGGFRRGFGGGPRRIAPLFHDGNIRGFSNVGRAMTDPRIRGGISSMATNEFGRSAVPRGQHLMQPGTLENARMVTGRVPAVPSRQSLQSVNRSPARATIRNGVANNQHFFGRTRSSFTPRPFNQSVRATQSLMRSYRNQPFTSRGQTNAFARNGGNAARSNDFTRPGTTAGVRSASGFSGRASVGGRPGNVTRSPAASRGGWQRFGQNGSARPIQGLQSNRGFASQPGRQAQPTTRPGWQRFGQNGNAGGPGRSQPSRSTPNQLRSAPGSGRGQQAPNRGRGGWQSFSQPSRQPNYGGSRGFNRQPLNLGHPIVNQRSYSPYGGRGGYSYGGRAPSYGGRAPSFGGGRAPSFGRAPSYGGRAPSYGGRAPSFGGGRGGYSGPRGGGYSAPHGGGGYRGGGGRSSGGGARGGGGGGRRH